MANLIKYFGRLVGVGNSDPQCLLAELNRSGAGSVCLRRCYNFIRSSGRLSSARERFGERHWEPGWADL